MYASSRYTLAMLQDDVCQLLLRGLISRQQPIYTLSRHIPARIWEQVERELESSDFLLRDPIGELVNHEQWSSD